MSLLFRRMSSFFLVTKKQEIWNTLNAFWGACFLNRGTSWTLNEGVLEMSSDHDCRCKPLKNHCTARQVPCFKITAKSNFKDFSRMPGSHTNPGDFILSLFLAFSMFSWLKNSSALFNKVKLFVCSAAWTSVWIMKCWVFKIISSIKNPVLLRIGNHAQTSTKKKELVEPFISKSFWHRKALCEYYSVYLTYKMQDFPRSCRTHLLPHSTGHQA